MLISLKMRLVVLSMVVIPLALQYVSAEDPLVFITAFAPGDEGAIHAYHMNPNTGQLTLAHKTTDVEHPFFIAISPDNRFLYSIHAPGQFGGEQYEQVASYALKGRTGSLRLLNRQSAMGSAACYLDVDSTGQTVLLANYTTGSIASFAVQTDGSISKATTFVQHNGSSINETRQEGPHAHSIVVSPDNRFVYVADLGLDQILGYRLNDSGAQLIPATQPFVRTIPGAGPRHLTFHPNKQHMYVINELANSITAFDYNSNNGLLIERQTLSTLPDDFEGTSHCADLKITPDGQFLYGTNRGHDSIATYRLDDKGAMTLLRIETSLGSSPQNLAITRDGKYLICANMGGNNVIVFDIDSVTGKITPVGNPLAITGPSCILIR